MMERFSDVTFRQMPSLALRDQASHLPHFVCHPLQPGRILHPFAEKLSRCYLPEESVLVRAPSAFPFLPAASDKFLPEITHLLRGIAVDDERAAFVNLELRPAVQGNELLAIQLERHCHHLA